MMYRMCYNIFCSRNNPIIDQNRGRCYVITGANSGIGKEAALGIAKRGGQVHMLCRNEERGNEAKKEIIEKTNSDTVYLHVVDVSEPESITKARNFHFFTLKTKTNFGFSLLMNGIKKINQFIVL